MCLTTTHLEKQDCHRRLGLQGQAWWRWIGAGVEKILENDPHLLEVEVGLTQTAFPEEHLTGVSSQILFSALFFSWTLTAFWWESVFWLILENSLADQETSRHWTIQWEASSDRWQRSSLQGSDLQCCCEPGCWHWCTEQRRGRGGSGASSQLSGGNQIEWPGHLLRGGGGRREGGGLDEVEVTIRGQLHITSSSIFSSLLINSTL